MVPKREGVELRVGHFLCERHFNEDDIVRTYSTKLKDGTIFTMPKSPPELRNKALPWKFDGPPHLSSKPPCKRRFKEPLSRPAPVIKRRKSTSNHLATSNPVQNSDMQNNEPENEQIIPATDNSNNSIEIQGNENSSIEIQENENSHQEQPIEPIHPFQIKDLHLNARLVKTPGMMWGVHTNQGKARTVYAVWNDCKIIA